MHSVRWTSFLALLLPLLFARLALADLQFTLYHQTLHPHRPKDIVPRGVVSFDPETNTISFTPSSTPDEFALETGIYRIGGFDSKHQRLSPAAFTRLVYDLFTLGANWQDDVKGPVTEEITLFLTADNLLYHISYFVKPSSTHNTIVKVIPDKAILVGPDPILGDPIVPKAETDAPEEVEKTFIQKYWIYIIPVVFILLTSGGGGGGQQEEGGGGSAAE
jgi:hypothetical protein